jgi:hypothetical protein
MVVGSWVMGDPINLIREIRSFIFAIAAPGPHGYWILNVGY